MTTKTSTRKLKLIPGRGLSGRDIKARLRNRTLSGQTFGPDAYMLDENMDEFMKMSTVERVNKIRENNRRINQIQAKLDKATSEKSKREQEQKIEQEVQKRMNEIGKQHSKNPSNETKQG